MSNDTPGSGDPREPGDEAPAHGEPPPAYPPPPPPPGGGGYGDGSYAGGTGGFQGGGYAAGGGDGYQEWPHDAPPGTGPGPGQRHKDPQAVSRGVKAAAYIFGVAVLLHLLTLAAVAISGDSDNAGFFLLEGMFVVVGGLVAAIVTTVKLPMDSRAPFWISGFAFMALQFIIWGVTCGIGFSISPLNIH